MKLKMVQRYFTFLHSKYDVLDESENCVFAVRPFVQFLAKYEVLDQSGNRVLVVKPRYFRFRRTIEILNADESKVLYKIRKRIRIAKRFIFENFADDIKWELKGDLFAYNFMLKKDGQTAAGFDKKLFKIKDTFAIQVVEESDAAMAVALGVLIDSWFHSSNKRTFNS